MSSTARTPNHDEGLSARSSITGKNEYLLSTNGALNTTGGGGGGGGGTQYTEGQTTAPAVGTVAFGRYYATPPSLTDTQLYGLQLDSAGNLKVSGATGSSNITSIIPGVGATNLGKADDAPMVTGDTGVMALAVSNEAQTNLVSTDGDYTPIGVDRAGRAYSKITDGTNIANTFNTSAGTAAGENALKITGGYREITVSGSSVSTILNNTDVSGYKWVSIHIVGTFSATYAFRGSNDAVNLGAATFSVSSSSLLNPQTQGTASNAIYYGPLNFRYLSLLITAYTSGTVTAVIELFTVAPSQQTIGGTVQSAGSTSVAIPTSAFPMGMNSGGLLVIPAATNTNADGASGASILGNASYVYNGSTYDHLRSVAIGDGAGSTGIQAGGGYLFNGTTWDRSRSIATGIQGVGVTDGTNSGNVLNTAVGTAAGQNAQLVSGAYREITGTASSATLAIASTDVSGYKWMSFHFDGAFSAVYTVEGSNNNTNWVVCNLTNLATTTASSQSQSSATNTIFYGPVNTRYVRVRIVTYTSGTVNVTGELFTVPPAINNIGAATLPQAVNPLADGSTTTNVNAAMQIYNGTSLDRSRSVINATNSTGTGILAVGALAQFDDVSPTAITENQFGNLRMSANRNAYTTIRDAAGNERGANVTANNSIQVVQQSSTGTPTNVAASATSVTLLAANTARIGGSIYNDSTALLYVKFGTTASTTSFKVVLMAGSYFEIPAGYNGRIDGIWASATGSARIDEDT